MLTGIFLVFFLNPLLAYSNNLEDELNVKQGSQVEVRAVFINCQMEENHLPYGSETRFQREELFKHNALRNCNKKLALTIKLTSGFDHSSGDEYIPIEHVFDGSNKKRVRLLNPYIIRLRRESPFEAYKLHKLDTFSGLLTTDNKKYQTHRAVTKNRLRRNIHVTDKVDWIVSKNDKDETNHECQKMNTLISDVQWQRKKRFDFDSKIRNNPFDENLQSPVLYSDDHETFKYKKNKSNFNMPPNIMLEGQNVSHNLSESVTQQLDGVEKTFYLYEVSDPKVWFKAQIQLIEKMSTHEGKTIWNHLTRQENARISSLCPEWTNQYVNIRYRNLERIPNEDFTLPASGVCLLLPKSGQLKDGFNDDKLGDFIIVPYEDIENIEETKALKRSHGNSSNNRTSGSEETRHRILVRLSRALFGRYEDNFVIVSDESGKYLTIPYRQPHHAQIEIEAKADDNQLVYVGSSGRLTTAVSENTRRSRAILTIQVTNTGLAAARLRPKIRECAHELLKFNEDDIGITVKPILIPPWHTHKFSLEIPLEIPGDISLCSVTLLNDGDESIAVRDVRIKRGDRCFCVWHCRCVCLSEDPKLLCQEMPEYEQVAAGLSPRDRPRQVRAVCYPDVVSINLIVIAFGVLLLLLALGLVKACLGLILCCVGSWGIEQLLQTPRRLDHYYESSLRSRTVVYDEEGWPVHPDTTKRTVRLISKPMEFMLNIIFFVTMPCLILWKSLKRIVLRCQNKEKKCGIESKPKKCCNDVQGNVEKETRLRWRHRRRHLSKWMSPQAEQLSTDIWRNGLAPRGYCSPECMRPLLREDRVRGKEQYALNSTVDSEQEDTEYVLMHMQNSRETLAKDVNRPISSVTVMD